MRRTIGAEEVEALTLSLLASGATIVGLWLVCPSYALFEAFLLGWRRGVKRKQRQELQRHVMHYCVLASRPAPSCPSAASCPRPPCTTAQSGANLILGAVFLLILSSFSS